MLQEIYQKFGCYVEKTKSYTLAGREGMERICRAMSDLRSKTPQQFGAHKVKVFEDYSNGTTKDFEFNLSFAARLPQCNVLRFTFGEGGNSSERNRTQAEALHQCFRKNACGGRAENQ